MDQRPPEHRDPPGYVDALYREHAASLYAWACLRTRGLRPLVSPEDLTQEVWVRATRAAPARGEAHGPPRAWLFTIAKHALYEVRRTAERLRREGAAGGSTSRLLAMGQVPVDITSLTQRVARDDAVHEFLRRVDELDDDDRMLLIHLGLEDLPQTEAAARLGLGYDTLAKRWQRLRARVRTWPGAAGLVS